MRNARRFMIGVGGILIAATGCDLMGSGTVDQGVTVTATERRLVVLLDATGSMTADRPGDLVNPNRFEAARSLSLDDLADLAGDAAVPLTGVRLFLFHNIGLVEQIPPNPDPVTEVNPDPDGDGWFAVDPVQRLIIGLPGPSGLTPMAGSMCDAADRFTLDPIHPPVPADAVKTLATYSDGGENNTNPMHECFGFGTTWQDKVEAHVLNAGVEFNGVLFTDVTGLAPPSPPDPEAALLAKQGKAPSPRAGLSDAAFFEKLAGLTGGEFRLVDDQAPVPVFADVSGDFAVDRTDAILLARQFGQPANRRFDLDNDGVIGFADYRIVVSRLGVGGGRPDPFVAREPVACSTSNGVVIDGQVIEDAAITIAAKGACKVTIKDSLIVSGQTAITIVGTAQVTVDNSIIVGEAAVITLRGTARLSAANSIFHGKTEVKGRIKLTDRGGNIFE